MKLNCARGAVAVFFLLGVSLIGALAEDWRTSDGKVYQEVKLIRLDLDTVTILDKDGGARIPLAKLSPELQKRFGYDPDVAKGAAEARAKEAALNAKELQAEMNKASAMHQAGPVADATATTTSDESTGPAVPEASASAAATVSGDGTHHFMDEMTTSASGRMAAAADASHHSIDEATQSATATRRDLNDPTYHTMAHLFYTIRTTGLGPDATDPTHHSINEATQAATGQK